MFQPIFGPLITITTTDRIVSALLWIDPYDSGLDQLGVIEDVRVSGFNAKIADGRVSFASMKSNPAEWKEGLKLLSYRLNVPVNTPILYLNVAVN